MEGGRWRALKRPGLCGNSEQDDYRIRDDPAAATSFDANTDLVVINLDQLDLRRSDAFSLANSCQGLRKPGSEVVCRAGRGAPVVHDDRPSCSGSLANIDDEAFVALPAHDGQPPAVASPFDQLELQQTANMCRFEQLGTAEANFTKRRFFVRTERCEHAPHEALPLLMPSLGSAVRVRQGLLLLRSFNLFRLGLDGGRLGKQGFSISLQGHCRGHAPDERRELALVTRFRARPSVFHSRTPSED